LGVVIARRFSLRQKLTALAPLLLLVASVPGQAMLRCRIDGLLRAACCCPHGAESESAAPAVKAADCCDRELSRGERPPAEAAVAANRDAAMTFAVAPATVTAFALPAPQPALARAEGTGGRYGPAREGPAIVLAKHAFLI
jgi:hypothetical protein